MWLVITVLLTGLLIYSRLHIPVFHGDQAQINRAK